MSPYNDLQRREIFHFLFLEELLRISDPKLYVLKGGVNLRFFFNSPRYSEDMDLDVLAGNVATLKKNTYKILESVSFKRSLLCYGITRLELNDPEKAKQTETTQRFKLRLVTEAGGTLPTKVEFSRRRADNGVTIDKIDPNIAKPYQRLAYRCQHYDGNAATLQKIRALAGRTITQARDVFDLDTLHSGGHLNRELLPREIDKETLNRATASLQTLSYQDFKGQVLEYLDEPTRMKISKEKDWEVLKQCVKETISYEE